MSYLRLSLILLVTACSSGVKLDPVSPKADNVANFPATENEARAVKAISAEPLGESSTVLSQPSVYFMLDSYVVGPEYKEMLAVHARYLSRHPERKALIQGHTDDRGSSEYNLALGQKRARAVAQALSLLGVTEAQMEAVSMGEEKPRALGHDELSRKENRRVDIVY